MIFYFSATGNSRFVAENIGREIGERIVEIRRNEDEGGKTIFEDGKFGFENGKDESDVGKTGFDAGKAEGEVVTADREIGNSESETKRQVADIISHIGANENIGFVFPIYGWRLPEIVNEFIHRLAAQINPQIMDGRYIWVAVTCGDDIGMADRCINRILRASGLHMDAIFSVTMPNTYVCLPGFDVDKPEIRRRKLSRCAERVATIAERVKKRTKIVDIHRGALPFFKTYVLGALFHRFLITDKPFHATDACTHCGLCARACPLSNISISLSALPQWHHRCIGCLRCYHQCPVRAIRFGKQTERKGQYTFRHFSAETHS